MTSSDLVSVCIPMFNGERYIGRTISSVLSQNYPSLEILVSDHSSSDRSLDIVEGFDDPRIRISTLAPGGNAADNWNASIKNTSGSFVKVLCQDDILKPNAIRLQVEALKSNPEASFCFSPRDIISPNDRVILKNRIGISGVTLVDREKYLNQSVRSGTNIFGEPCAVLISRKALDSAGFFEGSYLIDLNMWLRLWKIGPAILVDECLSQFRISGSSWTTQLKNVQSDQMIECIKNLSLESPTLVTAQDFKRGSRKAKTLSVQRSFLISLMELLHL